MLGRLNALQSLMWKWSELAPYNFIHAMRVPAPAEMDRWQKAVTAALRALAMRLPAIPIEQPATNLQTHLEAELHRPFSSADAPLRFFVVAAETGGHWFGIVLDHWVADDFSCRLLLQRLYSLYRGESVDADFPRQKPMTTRGRWRDWFRFLQQTRMLRRACRTALRDPMDFKVGTFRTALPAGALAVSQKLAREYGVTLHDLFLAATARAFGAARSWEGERRDAVAIVSAMDVRRFESGPARNDFGLQLSHYIVAEQRPHEVSLPDLSKRIAAQTRLMKADPATGVYGPALLLWRLSRSARAKATLFARGAPVVAGLSNVNLAGSWIEQSEIAEYRRIGPTGPIVPMVLMITTLRGRIFFDVTFRTAAFTPVEAEGLVKDIVQLLPAGERDAGIASADGPKRIAE